MKTDKIPFYDIEHWITKVLQYAKYQFSDYVIIDQDWNARVADLILRTLHDIYFFPTNFVARSTKFLNLHKTEASPNNEFKMWALRQDQDDTYSERFKRIFDDVYDADGVLYSKALRIGNYKIPFNMSELYAQTRLFFDELTSKYIDRPPVSHRYLPEDFREWLRSNAIGLTIPNSYRSFTEEDFEEFYNGVYLKYKLEAIRVRDRIWYYDWNPVRYTTYHRKGLGDKPYSYMIATHMETKHQAVAVFKGKRWVDTVPFRNYLWRMRAQNNLLRERQTVLYDMAKHYDMKAFEWGLNRRVSWSYEYSQVLYDVACDMRNRQVGYESFGFYKHMAGDSWRAGRIDELMWPVERYLDEHAIGTFLDSAVWFFHHHQLDFLTTINKMISIFWVIFWVDFFLHSNLVRKLEITRKYRLDQKHVFNKWMKKKIG